MDELDHNLLDAWNRVFEQCRNDPAEARRRYERVLPGGMFDRPVRAWCVGLRASDTRLVQGIGNRELGVGGESQDLKRWMRGRPLPMGSEEDDPIGAQAAHEIMMDGELIQQLGGPVSIPYPGVPLTEAAKMLGRDYGGMRRWLPVGAGRSRVERDRLAQRGMSDGRLIWATFDEPGFPLKVRYEPPGKHGRRGRETPVVWSDQPLDPGAARGMPPAKWWGSLWMSLAEKIPVGFEQVLERVPRFLPCQGEMRFRGWLWRCPGLVQGVGSRESGIGTSQSTLPLNSPSASTSVSPCGKLVPKLYAPLPVWTVGRAFGVTEGLQVEGLAGEWLPGVMDRWAGRRRLACRTCWQVRNGGSAERHGWNEFVTHLSGGLLFGSDVEKPADFQYERRRPRRARKRKDVSGQRGAEPCQCGGSGSGCRGGCVVLRERGEERERA